MMVNWKTDNTWNQQLRALPLRKDQLLQGAGSLLVGLILSAAALDGDFQPLALGLLCAVPPGILSALMALGGAMGYLLFWGMAGIQGTVWMGAGLLLAALCGTGYRRPTLMASSVAALVVAATGVVYQVFFADLTPIKTYLMRIAAAAGSAAVFYQWQRQKNGWSKWAVQAFGVLALAQIRPTRYLGFGYAAAGLLTAVGSFPAAVLAGLALDLSGITRVKMTGAMCLGWCLRKIPGGSVWWGCLSPGVGYLMMAALGGNWEICPLPALLLGGALAGVYPEIAKPMEVKIHAGEAAAAQVRLERMALALHQMEQSLYSVQDPQIDENALILRACGEACDSCPERRNCRARVGAEQLHPEILHQPGLGEEDLPVGCRKPTRLLGALRRGQEQLRRIQGDRNRLLDYRGATREQYAFLAEFLQGVSDDLATRRDVRPNRFQPEVAVSARCAGDVNGDRCVSFPGTGNQYFVLLCDGMGTGEAARRESREAVTLLQQMLSAGIAAEYALRSFNSLSILRESSGCTTVDLLQIYLDTGRGVLYKWGGASSWLIQGGQLRRLGDAMPPPGVSRQCRETAEHVALNRGETLILRSDGIEDGQLLQYPDKNVPVGELAASLVEHSSGKDDATVAVVHLMPA